MIIIIIIIIMIMIMIMIIITIFYQDALITKAVFREPALMLISAESVFLYYDRSQMNCIPPT